MSDFDKHIQEETAAAGRKLIEAGIQLRRLATAMQVAAIAAEDKVYHDRYLDAIDEHKIDEGDQ